MLTRLVSYHTLTTKLLSRGQKLLSRWAEQPRETNLFIQVRTSHYQCSAMSLSQRSRIVVKCWSISLSRLKENNLRKCFRKMIWLSWQILVIRVRAMVLLRIGRVLRIRWRAPSIRQVCRYQYICLRINERFALKNNWVARWLMDRANWLKKVCLWFRQTICRG